MHPTTSPPLPKFNSLLGCKDALRARIASLPDGTTAVATFLQAGVACVPIQPLEARRRRINAPRGHD
jgi:hypothetical protein